LTKIRVPNSPKLISCLLFNYIFSSCKKNDYIPFLQEKKMSSATFQVFRILDQSGAIDMKTRAMLSCAFPGSVDQNFLQNDRRKTVLRAKFKNALKYWTARRLRALDRHARRRPDFADEQCGQTLLDAGFPSFIHGYLLYSIPPCEPDLVQRMCEGTEGSRPWPHPTDKFGHVDHALWQTFYVLVREYREGRTPNARAVFASMESRRTSSLGAMGW
jgi:hypothetical protein